MHPSFLKLCVRQRRDRKVVEQSPRPMDPVDLSDSGHWRRQAAVIASPFALGSELVRQPRGRVMSVSHQPGSRQYAAGPDTAARSVS